MDFHEILMEGDFETDNVKSKDGISSFEINNSTGKITLKQNLKIESGSPSNDYVLVADGDGDCSFSPRTIPSNNIILFASDEQINGYTLLTNVNDAIVYITKGSAAGGSEPGYSWKTGGTWTMPSVHNHSITTSNSHIHATTGHAITEAELPVHDHYWVSYGSNGFNLITYPDKNIQQYLDTGGAHSYNLSGTSNVPDTGRTSDKGSSNEHDHGNVVQASGHNHGGNTGSNSSFGSLWRPQGVNFTRQQKN